MIGEDSYWPDLVLHFSSRYEFLEHHRNTSNGDVWRSCTFDTHLTSMLDFFIESKFLS
jgi:hypothetical protein